MDIEIYDSSSSSSGEEDLMDYMDLVLEQRIIRDRANPIENFNEKEFHARFRLTKENVRNLLELIGPNIAPTTHRNKSISALNQLLCTLRFLATGAFQNIIGDTIGIHKPTTSKILKRVLGAIAGLAPNYIRMPDSVQEIANLKVKFGAIHGFPQVIGCVDGTHVRIQSPGGENAEIYRNRKGYFSYNVQVVCDANLKIQSIDARWPGSTHDSTIFNASYLRILMEQNLNDCILLGDSAYPCRHYLMTPILNPQNDGEVNYNTAQIHTRNSIERCFGVWKRRFPALSVGMRTSKETTLIAIVAAAVLHNIAVDSNNEEEIPAPEVHVDEEANDEPAIDRNDGNFARRLFIENHFV